ncbi:hypothetical protein lacNasYZ03_17440 [Lactobacillus nasalidis]|uniref:DUF3953 domain-containing protein n=1 Tax=Lactobacillus nasalidis TaxID=2797258 RepID=A0ABQ3WAZ5_9LACO|nr:hypothetical protein [Lactobacillus nasalidis]GHV97432.1 hypothetical protein lacNasYZ01_06140 [Lactobacillus nasalidis]GHV99045.1 hypothetical protein lacNasYZ02_04750 [Lactobacillus nasalidis]GHW02057.1 hypothetical protein lacNasYZ03_17440 [Lactobacillus nasalidis]
MISMATYDNFKRKRIKEMRKGKDEGNMKQIVVKVLANTFILFILTYIVDHLTHHNSNYWNIIPISLAGLGSYELLRSDSVSDRVKKMINWITFAAGIILAAVLIYVSLME